MGYLALNIEDVLGGREFVKETNDYKDWSPNLLRYLIITENQIATVSHLGETKTLDIISSLINLEETDTFKAFTQGKAFSAFEGLFVSENLDEIIRHVPVEVQERLRVVGLIPELPAEASVEELMKSANLSVFQSVEQWHFGIRLQPATYRVDELVREKIDSYVGLAEKKEQERRFGLNPEATKKITGYYGATIHGAVDLILEQYGKIFASSFEVLQPFGVLTHDEHGQGVVLEIRDGQARAKEYDSLIQETYRVFQSKLDFTSCPVRKISEIANVVTTGFANAEAKERGEKFEGKLYFPNKMLEIVLGQNPKDTTLFTSVSDAKTWKTYSQKYVRPELLEAFSQIVIFTITNNDLTESFFSQEAKNLVDQSVRALRDALLRCVLVQKYETLRDVPVVLKVRVLDPQQFSNEHPFFINYKLQSPLHCN